MFLNIIKINGYIVYVICKLPANTFKRLNDNDPVIFLNNLNCKKCHVNFILIDNVLYTLLLSQFIVCYIVYEEIYMDISTLKFPQVRKVMSQTNFPRL
jgi:hypothetical protein